MKTKKKTYANKVQIIKRNSVVNVNFFFKVKIELEPRTQQTN